MNVSGKQFGLGAALMLPIAIVGAWATGWFHPENAKVPQAPPPAAVPPANPIPPPATAVTTPPIRQQAKDQHLLAMPDGSFLEPLNGVAKPAAIVWGNQPWSKVVRVQHDPGCDWYVHEDGTYTTTLMRWRSDLHRDDPVTLCLHPAAPAAVDPGDDAAGGTKKD